jgi:diguanylate cyclase
MDKETSTVSTSRAFRRDVLSSFLLVLVVFAVVIAAIMATRYTQRRTNELARLEADGINALELRVKLIDHVFTSVTSDLLFLAGQKELVDFARTGDQGLRDLIADEYYRFSIEKRMYDQILFIAVDGTEIVRIHHKDGHSTPTVMANDELRTVASQEYFDELRLIGPDDVYVSRFDLNMENGVVETPEKPLIRLGVGVYDDTGVCQGYVMLNYLGERLFALIEGVEDIVEGSVLLANRDGYLLYGPNPEKLWGFRIAGRSEHTITSLYPSTWPTINTQPRGRQYTPDGLFLYNTAEPLDPEALTGNKQYASRGEDGGYYWKIISHIRHDTLQQQASDMRAPYIYLWLAFVILSTFPSWIVATRIVRRKMDRLRLFHMAHYDGLTGLPNRNLFYDRLEQTIMLSRRYKRTFALLYMDLDGFKAVNDTLGHDNGDLLLQVIASRLQGCVRASDTVARMGGDEFTVLLTTIAEPADAALVAGKIRDVLSKPMDLSGKEHQITVSIGISFFPEHGDDPDLLLKRADASMYDAKISGKNAFRFYK